MLVRTKIRHTKKLNRVKRARTTLIREKNVPWRVAFRERIKKHSEGGIMLRGSRFKADITQRELAGALGISQHHISEMENGKRPIGKEMAKRLADFFKTDYRIFL